MRQIILDYVTVAALVAVTLVVAFCTDESATVRGRVASVRTAWRRAAADSTMSRRTPAGLIVQTSTKSTALRLLRDVIGDL